MNLLETTLSSQVVYKGKILTLKKDQVRLPNGGTGTREVVVHNGAVCIAPIDKEGNVILVRQYRTPSPKSCWNCPPGKLTPARTSTPPLCGSWRRSPAALPGSFGTWGHSSPLWGI